MFLPAQKDWSSKSEELAKEYFSRGDMGVSSSQRSRVFAKTDSKKAQESHQYRQKAMLEQDQLKVTLKRNLAAIGCKGKPPGLPVLGPFPHANEFPPQNLSLSFLHARSGYISTVF
jgi:hypothetical protein